MTNIISTLGAGSGIDTLKLVDDLITIERSATDTQLDTRQTKYDSQISGYGALRSSMAAIQDSLELLTDSDTFNSRNVNFPETNLLTPTTVDAEALTGEYSIKVLGIATAHALSTDSASLYDDPDGIVGSGTLTFSFGDWDGGTFSADGSKTAQSITIDDSNNTLSGIRDAINKADFGVQAAVINTGNGYQLQITAPSGSNNEMEIVVTEDGAPGLSALAYNTGNLTMDQNQVGLDASLEVNGLSISRESNQIDDVIQGLEFTLNNPSATETVAITISDDKSFAEQAVRDFIAGYNEFLSAAESLTGTGSDDEDASVGSLATDGSAKTMINQIRSVITQTISGLDGSFTSLATLGIKTEIEDGSLSIDEDQFSSVLDDNFAQLTSLFTATTTSTDARIEVLRVNASTQAGSFAVDITTDPTKGGWQATNAIATTTPAYQPASDDFAATLSADASHTFKVSVDGTSSDTITLSGDFNSAEEIRAKLQSLINGDSALSAVGAAVDVGFDSATDTFSFNSRAWGSASKVEITESGAGMVALGIDKDNGTTTLGVDVQGTIDGTTAFGSGNILLPELDSALSGLSLQIAPGAAAASVATVTHSRGFGNEMNNILDSFLARNGLIETREDTLNARLDEIDDDRTDLDTRMEVRRAQLESQFLAMERIISSLNATSDSLDGLIDRLPFTATNS